MGRRKKVKPEVGRLMAPDQLANQSATSAAPLNSPRKSNRMVKVPRQMVDYLGYESYVWSGVLTTAEKRRRKRNQLKKTPRPSEVWASKQERLREKFRELLACTECISAGRRGPARYMEQGNMVVCSSPTCSRAVHVKCLPESASDIPDAARELAEGFLCANCAVCKECGRPTGEVLPNELVNKFAKRVIWCAGCFTCHHVVCAQRGAKSVPFVADGWKCRDCMVPIEWKTLASDLPNQERFPSENNTTACDGGRSMTLRRRYTKIDRIWQEKRCGNDADGLPPTGGQFVHMPSGVPLLEPFSPFSKESPQSRYDWSPTSSYMTDAVEMFDRAYTEEALCERKVLAHWTTDNCAEHFDSCNFPLADLIRKHDMDGSTLLIITRTQFIQLFGLALGPALKMHYAVCELRRSFF